MRYGIGLDIGIASVGYAVMELDQDDLPIAIARIGSRIFDVAENPKDGASLALPRREARGARRRTRRRKHRKERIRSLIVSKKLLTLEELNALFKGKKLPDIYELRSLALYRLITNKELARLLIHLAQRRGFHSNRNSTTTKEDGVLLKAISANEAEMKQHGYQTVGEMLYKDARYQSHKRNKSENYLNTVSRDMVEHEVKKIFTQQREFGSSICTPELENAYLGILLAQRSFDEGPGPLSTGAENPYAKGIEGMVGICTFEQREPRAPKASYSFEYFELLQKVNHLRLDMAGKTMPLTGEQRKILIELAHISPNLHFGKIRKALALPEDARFNAVRKYIDGVDVAEKSEKFKVLQAYHEMRKAFDKVRKGRIADISIAERNEIGRIFSLYKNEARVHAALDSAGFAAHDCRTLVENLGSFSKFGHLSIIALNKIIPFLEEGYNYNEACEKAGYDFKGNPTGNIVPTISLSHLADEYENTVTSPVAKRAISQCAKVVNAIVRELGNSPVYINIELAREMAKNFKDRRESEKGMLENAADNERIKERITTEFRKANPTGLDIVKLKLYKQQAEMCLYSLEQLDVSKLFEPGYADVDHIVPYSKSFDDSYKNKVLVKSSENRQKGNRLPLEYLTGERRDKFIVWINASNLPIAKKRLLLKEELSDADLEGFKERNLQDTKTISSFLHNYLTNYLSFAPFKTNRKRHVTAVNGAVSSMLRSRWGLAKVRTDGDMHHAIDAAIIACTTQGDVNQASMIGKVQRYYENKEQLYLKVDKSTGDAKERFPLPYEGFVDELVRKVNTEVFVSRMPSRKMSGAAHKETIKGVSHDGMAIKKVPLTALKLDKDGEIADYYNQNDDKLLYNALKSQLVAHGGNGENAFVEPFYKPKNDGSSGPLVKKVKVLEKSNLTVPVHNKKGIADNDNMVRIDVFHVEGDGYYIVPIYVADTVKETLPNKAIVAAKPYEEWKDMNNDNFIFSLYPNDLIYVKAKKQMTFSKVHNKSKLPEKLEQDGAFAYYKGANISGGTMSVITHDNSYKIASLGAKTLQIFEKYQVDVLGNISKVGRESRQGFAQKRR